jgi:hypothetical protein
LTVSFSSQTTSVCTIFGKTVTLISTRRAVHRDCASILISAQIRKHSSPVLSCCAKDPHMTRLDHWRCFRMRRIFLFPCITATISSGTFSGRYTIA